MQNLHVFFVINLNIFNQIEEWPTKIVIYFSYGGTVLSTGEYEVQ